MPLLVMAQVQIPTEIQIIPILRDLVSDHVRVIRVLIVRPLCSRFLPVRDNAAGPGHGARGGPGLLSDKI